MQLPLCILLHMHFFPLNFILTALIHDDTLYSQSVPAGICRFLCVAHKISVFRACYEGFGLLAWFGQFDIKCCLFSKHPWELCAFLLKLNLRYYSGSSLKRLLNANYWFVAFYGAVFPAASSCKKEHRE